jgi:hypothetical protein
VEYLVIPDCGHSAHENEIEEALVDAAEKFKALKIYRVDLNNEPRRVISDKY